jgi:hypothetical protein
MQGVVLLILGADSSLGPAKVGGSMNSANVKVAGGIASFTLGNDLRAGSAGGLICSVAGDIGAVKIGGDVYANDSLPSGGVLAQGGNVKSVTIGGNVTGGKGVAGSGLNGGVYASGRIGNVYIGGDVTIDPSFAGQAESCATGVRAGQDIGHVKIRGDVAGTGFFEKVEVTAFKNLNPAIPVAIKPVTVGGNVSAFEINAGHPLDGVGIASADVQVGNVTVGGNWTFSSMRVGVSGPVAYVGDGKDVLLPGNTPGIISRIASVTIKGAVYSGGAPFPTAIVAEDIGSLSIGGGKVPLAKFGGAKDRFVLGTSGNVRIYEI